MKLSSKIFKVKKITLITLLFLFILLLGFHVKGNTSKLSEGISEFYLNSNLTNTSTPALRDLNDSFEFETFVDSIISQQLTDFNIVGATFSAVKDGKIYLNKGYGYEYRHLFQLVNPNSTLFRIGSISKTFTAIATLQLVENALLDLDVDVNTYLTAFKIPETYSEPITLRHLLTHSAGFEEYQVGVIANTFFGIPDVEDLLRDYIPARVHAPGEITSYSNYGLGLVAYIVEKISGKTFENYIHDEIAVPLGMNYTSFQQPLPSNLDLLMSKGYDSDGNQGYFENVLLPGAGAGSSSAGDMARLMLALLNNGTFDGSRILNNETVTLMQEDHFSPHPSLPGVGFGLYEFDVNNEHIIGHGGDTIFFHSRMVLFPEHDFGFFLSYNSYNGAFAKGEFFNAFIEEYFPKDMISYAEVITENLKDFEGTYLSTRRFYNKYYTVKPHLWLEDKFSIETNSSHLMIKYISSPFVQISPDFFVSQPDFVYDFYLFFVRNDDGKVTHFYSNFFPSVISYEKINPIHVNSQLYYAFVITIGAIYTIILALWGLDGVFRAKRKEKRRPRIERLSKWWSFGVYVFGAIPIIIFTTKSSNVIILANETKEKLSWLIAFSYIDTILILGLLILSGISWYNFSSIARNKPSTETEGFDQIKIEQRLDNKKKERKIVYENIKLSLLVILGTGIITFYSIWNLYGF